jgi:NAD(P)H-hydrate epimerase
MKIFSAPQIRVWDAFTIEHEPVSSVNLMNRAAGVFADWFMARYPDQSRPIVVMAGTGNNGGDGVAVARFLHSAQFAAKLAVCNFGTRHSADFDQQMTLLPTGLPLISLNSLPEFSGFFQELAEHTLFVDALFGSGLNRPLTDDWAEVIHLLNNHPGEKVSIDTPSGLLMDQTTAGAAVVRASRVFSFEAPKRAFFFPENEKYTGKWEYGSIGLHPDYETTTDTPFHYLTEGVARKIIQPRSVFSHKGSYGHALIVAGSYGKMGAAVLASRACLRAGAGLLTVHAPRCGYIVLQGSVPEAMYSPDHRAQFLSDIPDLESFNAVGVGPGIGQAPETARALEKLLCQCHAPLVLDADALNLLALNRDWFDLLPENTIMTPHPKEFERLFGKTPDNFARNELQRAMAVRYRTVIVLKGAHTAVALPDGSCWFNSSGNPAMATAGAGDVLTGVITGLLAQGYTPEEAALLGVWAHGHAGDMAVAASDRQSLIAGDIIDFIFRK